MVIWIIFTQVNGQILITATIETKDDLKCGLTFTLLQILQLMPKIIPVITVRIQLPAEVPLHPLNLLWKFIKILILYLWQKPLASSLGKCVVKHFLGWPSLHTLLASSIQIYWESIYFYIVLKAIIHFLNNIFFTGGTKKVLELVPWHPQWGRDISKNSF